VIAAEPGREIDQDPLHLELGPRLLEKKDLLLGGYLERIAAGYRQVLDGLARSSSDETRRKAVLIEQKVSEIEKEVAKCR
jgi:tRNA (adenine22-N1)-methyltransferase